MWRRDSIGLWRSTKRFRLSKSRARITQIMNLSNMAPEIQEHLLFPAVFLPPERRLRRLTVEVEWGRQRRLWHDLVCKINPCKSI